MRTATDMIRVKINPDGTCELMDDYKEPEKEKTMKKKDDTVPVKVEMRLDPIGEIDSVRAHYSGPQSKREYMWVHISELPKKDLVAMLEDWRVRMMAEAGYDD